jgi:hypothetical protein
MELGFSIPYQASMSDPVADRTLPADSREQFAFDKAL